MSAFYVHQSRTRATGEARYAGRGGEVFASNFESIDVSLRYLDVGGVLGGRFYAEAGATLSVLLFGEDDSFFESEPTSSLGPLTSPATISLHAWATRHRRCRLLDENADAVGDDFKSQSYSFQLTYYS